MAISVVQVSGLSTGDNVTSLTSSSAGWTSNVTAGSSVLAVAYAFDNDATGLTFSSLTWSAGGSFTEATTALVSNGNDRYRVSCFYLHAAAGGGTKPTATLTPSQGAYMNFMLAEVAGLANAAEVAENTNTSMSSTTGPTPGAVTTTDADTLVVLGYIGIDTNPQTHTAPAGYNKFGEQTDNNNHQAGCGAYQVWANTLSAHNPAWTTSNSRYAATITAFKAAPPAASVPAAPYPGLPPALLAMRHRQPGCWLPTRKWWRTTESGRLVAPELGIQRAA